MIFAVSVALVALLGVIFAVLSAASDADDRIAEAILSLPEPEPDEWAVEWNFPSAAESDSLPGR